MERLTELYSVLSLDTPSQNLQFVTMDEHHSQTPPFKMEENDLYLLCQTIVRTAMCLFAYAIGLPTLLSVLYTYKRSRMDATHAEQFLLKYDVPDKEIIKDEHYYFALNWITEKFRPKWKIHPVHFTDLRWYPWKTSTSAERPYTITPYYRDYLTKQHLKELIPNQRMTFGNLYTKIFEHSRSLLHNVKHGLLTSYPDAIQMHVKPALVRIDEPEKVRSVWGIPKYFIFAEAMFFWPLFSHYFTEKVTPLLWNYESLNGGWHRLNAEYQAKYPNAKFTIFNTDWSEFDMRVYFSVWQDLIDKVKTYFCFCGAYCPAGTYPHPLTDPLKLHRLWIWFTEGYFQLLCVSPLGKVFRRLWAGMPSGIFCTQFWDSLYNGLMIVTCLHALGIDIDDDFFLKLMGDDALFHVLKDIPVTEWTLFLIELSKEADRRFGSKLSAEKSKVSRFIHGAFVLGYQNWNGWPKRDTEDVLARLLYPKTMRDTPERLMARSVGIAYAAPGDIVIYKLCKHIHNELKHQGYMPSITGLHSMFDPLGISLTEEDLLIFPSETEIAARISKPSQRSQQNQAKYWDRYHFHMEAGLAHCTA